MRKAVNLFLIVAFISVLASCGGSKSDLIVGEWTLESGEVENIDDLVKKQSEDAIKMIDEQIATITASIAATEDEEGKKALETQKVSIEAKKGELSVEKLKAAGKKQTDAMAGKIKMTFNADKTFTGSTMDKPTKGTWAISEDGKSLTTKDDNGEQAFNLVELSATKLVISISQGEGEMMMKMKMSFKK